VGTSQALVYRRSQPHWSVLSHWLSDGYNAGFGDVAAMLQDYQNKDEYHPLIVLIRRLGAEFEDYRDGLPAGSRPVIRAVTIAVNSTLRFLRACAAAVNRCAIESSAPNNSVPNNSIVTNVPDNTAGQHVCSDDEWIVVYPRDTILSLELLTPFPLIHSACDRFQARVTAPGKYAGALVDGRVTQVSVPAS